MTLIKKIIVMAILGALGAAAGAAAGESLFLRAPEPQQREPREICLLIDISGSMNEVVSKPHGQGVHSQLEALQDAACDFVARQDLDLDAMGLAVFSSGAYVVTQPIHDKEVLKQCILDLSAHGGTNLGRGLDMASGMLPYKTKERWVLLFSDGKPGNFSTHESAEAAALSAAARARLAGIQIVAIGTGLADANLLAEITGSPDNVIISDPTALAEAFKRSEEVINNRHMLASQAGMEGFVRALLTTGVWACLIAVGAALGLVVGMNRHLHRGFLSIGDVSKVLFGGVITGLLAGAAGQALFYVLSDVQDIESAGRFVAWALLGLGIGYGMGFFVPNLPKKRAGIAGAIGGVIAAYGFLELGPMVDDRAGRVLGAAILGLAVGMTTVLVEALYKKAWLVVHWNAKERSTLALGPTPILVGASSEAHVLLAESDSPVPVMARIMQTENGPRLEDGQTNSARALRDGEVLDYGRIRLQVRASETEAGSSDDSRGDAAPRQQAMAAPRKVTAGSSSPSWLSGH